MCDTWSQCACTAKKFKKRPPWEPTQAREGPRINGAPATTKHYVPEQQDLTLNMISGKSRTKMGKNLENPNVEHYEAHNDPVSIMFDKIRPI